MIGSGRGAGATYRAGAAFIATGLLLIAGAAVPTQRTTAATATSATIAGPATAQVLSDQTITQNVLLVVYDPTLPNNGGQRLHAAYGWQDPITLTNGVVADLEQASHGVVHFNIVKTQILDAFPRHVDGFVYDESTWERDWTNHSPHQSKFDWQNFLETNDIVAQIDSGAIDEVWIYQDPLDQDQAWESTMAGEGGYWLNSPPVSGNNGPRAFVIMSWNYERGVAEAIHSYGHRVESTMCRMYDTCGNPTAVNNWNKFTTIDKNAPGHGAVGNVHFPVNGLSDYDYDNQRYVLSDADAWLNYPDLSAPPRMINATEWSPNRVDPQREYLDWWYAHIPHAAGRNADGRLNDWWQYIIKVDQYKDGDLGVGLPAVDLSTGITPGVVRTGGAFTTSSLVLPYSERVTILFRVSKGTLPAGTPIQIWVETRASRATRNPWGPQTTRLLGADGTARYYPWIAGWTAIRGYVAATGAHAATWTPARIATVRAP